MSKKKDIIVDEKKEEIVNEDVVEENLETIENPIVKAEVDTMPVVENAEIKEEPIVENIEESVSVNSNTVSANPKQRKIVIATPTYFVVEKDGSNVVVYEQNSYRRGDTVLY